MVSGYQPVPDKPIWTRRKFKIFPALRVPATATNTADLSSVGPRVVFPQAERGLEGKEVLCQDCESDLFLNRAEPRKIPCTRISSIIHLFSDQFCLSMWLNMIQHGLMMLNAKNVAITCLVRLPCLPTSSKSQRCAPSRLDAPVTLLSSASRAKGQLPLWKRIVNYCCIRLISDYIRLYMMSYYCCTCDIIASFSYILIVDHSPMMVMLGSWWWPYWWCWWWFTLRHMSHTSRRRLQDGGYDGASRPGFRSCFGMHALIYHIYIDYITHDMF